MKVNEYWEKDYIDLMEENKLYKVRQQNLEKELKVLQLENISLKHQLSNCSQNSHHAPDSPLLNGASSRPLYSVDDIEALKQQVIFYLCFRSRLCGRIIKQYNESIKQTSNFTGKSFGLL